MRPAGSQLRSWAFLGLFLAASLCAVNLQTMVDPDLFWHLRAGKDIVEAGHPVLPDSWNYLFGGKVWVNQQWLTQILMVSAFQAFGYGGLVLLKDLVAAGVVLLILATFRDKPEPVRFLCAGVFVAVTARYFLFRTNIFSFLGMAALLFLLERVGPRKRLPALVLLFAAWANIHALFGLGLLVLGIYAGVRWFQAGRVWTRDLLWEWASVPLAASATLVNPFGTKVWETAIAGFGQPETFLVTEWWPMWKYPVLANVGFYALFILLATLFAFFPKRPHLPSLVSYLILAALAVRSVRFAPVATLPALPLLAGLLEQGVRWAEGRGWEARGRKLLPALCAGLVTFSVVATNWNMAHPIVTPHKVTRQDYPVQAIRWMKVRGLTGKIFNEFDAGGYIVWSLPGAKTFIDGRGLVLLFPWGHMTAWKETVDLAPGWRNRLNQGRPDYVLLYADDYLSQQLLADPEWIILYRDSLHVLFGRRSPAPIAAE